MISKLMGIQQTFEQTYSPTLSVSQSDSVHAFAFWPNKTLLSVRLSVLLQAYMNGFFIVKGKNVTHHPFMAVLWSSSGRLTREREKGLLLDGRNKNTIIIILNQRGTGGLKSI